MGSFEEITKYALKELEQGAEARPAIVSARGIMPENFQSRPHCF